MTSAAVHSFWEDAMRPLKAHQRWSMVSVAATVLLIGVAQAATAQRLLPSVEVNAPRASKENARADTLEAAAVILQEKPRHYLEAARLYRRAAMLRGDDTAAVTNFRKAAWLFSAFGDNGAAQVMMEKAAECATRVGDVERAANAYVDAAVIAVASGRKDRLPSLLDRTQALLSSPLLSEDGRANIMQRIQGTSVLAGRVAASPTRP